MSLLDKITAPPARSLAIAESLIVTVIWASSFVLVKMALSDIGPLTIAGLRYFLGFVILSPFTVRRNISLRNWSPGLWVRLVLIGLLSYTTGNGALFWGLQHLPSTVGSFVMSLVPILVLFAGMLWLKEMPELLQVVGLIVGVIGGVLFFNTGAIALFSPGMALMGVAMVSFAASTVLVRGIARVQAVDTLSLTAMPLAFGGGVTLFIALLLEGVPGAPVIVWGIVLVLAVVNTALGYILYNHAMQTLAALEMNVILNLIPLCTAVIAWLLLDERLAFIQIIGMITVIAGVMLVQWGRRDFESPVTHRQETDPSS